LCGESKTRLNAGNRETLRRFILWIRDDMTAASQLKENAMKKLSIALVCALIIPMFASVADARGRDKADFHYEGTTKCWSNNTRCK
jgi:hypothetical protein